MKSQLLLLQRTTLLFLFLFAADVKAEPGSNKWFYATGAPLLSSPSLSTSGVLYFGSYDEYFYAVNSSDGSLRWRFSVKMTRTNQAAYVHSSPSIGSDGTIYFGTEERYWLSPANTSGTLYALNPNGTQKWKYAVSGSIFSDPAIGPDGTIYFGAYDTNLHAVTPEGTLKWKYPVGGGIFSDPVIAGDGTIYFGCDDGNLYALTPSGTLKWTFAVGSAISASPAIAADGTVLIGTAATTKFYAVNPNGSLKWQFDTAGTVHSSAAVGADGTIYFGSNDGSLYALNANGSERWKYECGTEIKSSPALASDGTIYFGCNDGKLYALASDGSFRWSATTADYIYGSPVISSDGTVFVTSADNSVYAFEGSSALAEAPWPMFRRDALHTARMPAGADSPPTISTIANQSIVENSTSGPHSFTIGDLESAPGNLTLSASSSNTELVPVANITFGGADSSRNVTVTPATDQTGSSTITITVQDAANNSAQTSFVLTVTEGNTAPSLEPIANQSVNEGSNLTITAVATDTDTPSQTLTYSLSEAPAGATIDPATGAFKWTPTESQGPGSYTITVLVTDSGSPNLSASRSFVTTVLEVNSAPTLVQIPEQKLQAGDTLNLTVSAADSDLPSNQLTFSLVQGPSGATLDPNTGALAWSTSSAHAGTTNLIRVRVDDNGTPVLGAEISFNVVVDLVAELRVQSITYSSGLVTIVWSATAGRTYRLQFASADLSSWEDIPGDVLASGASASKQDAPIDSVRFYRVLELQ